jgi:hypothetical protein
LSVHALVARQHGVVSAAQLRAAGLGPSTISRWARSGRLRRMYPGVYAYGHLSLRPEGLQLAATLAGGPGALLGHRAAALARDMRRDAGPIFEITVPRRRARAIPGIRAYHFPLHPDDVSALNGVPMTSVARTCVDVAGVVPAAQLPAMLQRADELRILDRRALEAAIERAKGRRGMVPCAPRSPSSTPIPRSCGRSSSGACGGCCASAGCRCPTPTAGRRSPRSISSGPGRAWRWSSTATRRIEDGWRSSATASAASELEARGYRVLRVSWRQFTQHPDHVLAALGRVLAERS